MAVLTDARLDHKFWGEAATAVTWALNRTPQRGHALTPFEMFYGHRPDVSFMRVFGCRAWAYVPPDIRRKMDPRALPATHLGYEQTCGSGKRWDAPATVEPQTVVAGPTG